MSYNDNPYIAHYGVLGMRWGRRMHRSAAYMYLDNKYN